MKLSIFRKFKVPVKDEARQRRQNLECKIIVFFLFSIFYFLFSFPSPTYAVEEGTGPPECIVTTIPDKAPSVTDAIFATEQFLIHASDSTNPFQSSLAPYKATITTGIPPQETTLGNMRLGFYQGDESPECKCVEYRREKDGGRTCIKWEAYDPCDQKNSPNLVDGDPINVSTIVCKSENDDSSSTCTPEEPKFQFNVLGPATIKIYDNANKLICVKDTNVLNARTVTVTVYQPLKPGELVQISGAVEDHEQRLSNVPVSITIPSVGKSVQATTTTNGTYTYNQDATYQWGLTDGSHYDIVASIDGGKVQGTNVFDVSSLQIPPPYQSTGGKTGTLVLNRSYNKATGDHWTWTSKQMSSTPSDYTLEGTQGYVYSQDDGSGALVPFYDCVSGGDHFNSSNEKECSKDFRPIVIGYLYLNQASNTSALYRCIKKDSLGQIVDRKTSLNETCTDEQDIIPTYSLDIKLGYALNNTTAPNCPITYTEAVHNPFNNASKIADKMEAVLLYPGIRKDDLNKPDNSLSAQIGVDQNILVKFITQLACSISNLFGSTTFCPQLIQLAEGTNLLSHQVGSLYNSQVAKYPRDPQKGSPSLHDANNCETGDHQTGYIGNQMGTASSALTADFPKQVLNTVKQDTTEKLCQGSYCYGDDSRAGFVSSNTCLYFQGVYAKGVVPLDMKCTQ